MKILNKSVYKADAVWNIEPVERNKMKIFTQVIEVGPNEFAIHAGEDFTDLREVGREKSWRAAQGFARWWAQSLGAQHVNQGFQPLVPVQGRVQGH